ncbi:MAG: cadherin-like beta sandwich domain-containing protein, partial [Lachnospiraceae bacterium]|nr:cadherin-like beta sandwich domain-containing protein [Lachnospiraceae bacterium]
NNSNNNNNSNNDDNNDNPDTSEEDDRSSNCNLKSLQISPGVLEPAFSPSTTSYFVQVDEDVTSMVVSAVAEDDNATTAVRGAGLIEPGANTVTITVTAENGAVKVYTLSVAAGEILGDAKTVIDGVEYSFVQDSNGLEYPEGYMEITTTYKDWDVLAFESPNKKVVLVCLEPEVENGEESSLEWFIYDKDNEIFIPYREYSSEFNRYVIIEAPEGMEIPKGFEKTEIDIGGIGERVVAYKSSMVDDADMYLVYAINISGDEGFYWYDAKERSFLRYAEVEHIVEETPVATETVATVAEPEIEESPAKDEGFFTKKILAGIAIGLGVLAFLLLILVITLIVLMKRKNDDSYDSDDETEYNGLDNTDKTDDKTERAEGDNTDSDSDNPEAEHLYKEVSEEELNSPKEVYTEEDAQKAYEEDREIKPVSFNLENMEFNSENPKEEDKQICIMSFKKKNDEANEEAKEEVKEEKKEVLNLEEATEETTDEPDEVPLVNIDSDRDDRAYEYDYVKQSEVINEKIKNGYDANLDSAFADDENSDK